MTVIKRQIRTTKTRAEVLMLVLDNLVEPLDGSGYRLESLSIHGVAFACPGAGRRHPGHDGQRWKTTAPPGRRALQPLKLPPSSSFDRPAASWQFRAMETPAGYGDDHSGLGNIVGED